MAKAYFRDVELCCLPGSSFSASGTRRQNYQQLLSSLQVSYSRHTPGKGLQRAMALKGDYKSESQDLAARAEAQLEWLLGLGFRVLGFRGFSCRHL